jgi:hypothetical protein
MMIESLRLIVCNGWTEDKTASRCGSSVPLGWSDCQGKNGKGKISTEAIALILAHPGEPIFRETTPARARCRFFAISPQMNLTQQ